MLPDVVEALMMLRSYPSVYRHRVIDLIESGISVAEVADGLEVVAVTI
jgi:hypothetical protein